MKSEDGKDEPVYEEIVNNVDSAPYKQIQQIQKNPARVVAEKHPHTSKPMQSGQKS